MMWWGLGNFGSVSMLGWSLAALIPLLFHLRSRRWQHEEPWAAMEFLQAALQQQTRRIRIEQLFLLVLRMSIPCLLALALADPVWLGTTPITAGNNNSVPRHTILVMDVSWSMGYQEEGVSRWQQAVSMAETTIQNAREGDGFTLITMGSSAEYVLEPASFRAAEVSAELAKISLVDLPANLPNSLDLVRLAIEDVARQFPRLEEHVVYVFTDLGANTWEKASEPVTQDMLVNIASRAKLVMVDVGQSRVSNSAIVNVTRSPSLTTVTKPTTWTVHVGSLVGTLVENTEVELWIDDQLVQRKPVRNLPSHIRDRNRPDSGTASVELQHAFDRSGQHRVRFRLTSDGLAADNEYFEVVDVRNRFQVLCVEGRPGEAERIALALVPAPSDSEIQVRVIASHQLDDVSWKQIDAIFLCNLPRLSSQLISRLNEHVFLRSGGLIIFLGDQVNGGSYNQSLTDPLGNEPLLPVRLLNVAQAPEEQLDPLDYQHPVVAPFRGQERAGLLSTPVWQYVRLAPIPNVTYRPVLQFANGDPLILEYDPTRGRVLLVTTAASELSQAGQGDRATPWTAWSAWPSFPPIIHELLTASMRRSDENENLVVGEALICGFEPRSLPTTLSVRDPTSSSITLFQTTKTNSSQSTATYSNTLRRGFYRVTSSEPTPHFRRDYAVNLAQTDEGSLERIDPNQLPPPLQVSPVERSPDDAPSTPHQRSLYPYILCGLLGFLLLESTTAWYLGNRGG